MLCVIRSTYGANEFRWIATFSLFLKINKHEFFEIVENAQMFSMNASRGAYTQQRTICSMHVAVFFRESERASMTTTTSTTKPSDDDRNGDDFNDCFGLYTHHCVYPLFPEWICGIPFVLREFVCVFTTERDRMFAYLYRWRGCTLQLILLFNEILINVHAKKGAWICIHLHTIHDVRHNTKARLKERSVFCCYSALLWIGYGE